MHTQEAIRPIWFELVNALRFEALNHPGIVHFEGMVCYFPSELTNAEVGLVFELPTFGTLFDLLYHKKISILRDFATRMQIAIQVSDALKFLHESNLMYRALNCNNVLIVDEFSFHAKICDFSLARQIIQEDGYLPTTISGSPSYMSPEQLKGTRLTLKSDVWSMAVLLWELLSLQPPWEHFTSKINDVVTMWKIIVDEKLRLPLDWKKSTPQTYVPPLTVILERCFKENPPERPNMSQFFDLLSKIVPHVSRSQSQEKYRRGGKESSAPFMSLPLPPRPPISQLQSSPETIQGKGETNEATHLPRVIFAGKNVTTNSCSTDTSGIRSYPTALPHQAQRWRISVVETYP